MSREVGDRVLHDEAGDHILVLACLSKDNELTRLQQRYLSGHSLEIMESLKVLALPMFFQLLRMLNIGKTIVLEGLGQTKKYSGILDCRRRRN